MSERYGVGLQQGVTTTVDGATGTNAAGDLTAATTNRPQIYDLVFSHGSAPADTVIRWEVIRSTTANTGGAAVENALNPASPTALAAALEEITAAGTITADSQVLDMDLNQRATFRWVAAPGSEFIVPATANNAFLINASSASYAGISRVTVLWDE